MYYTSTERSPMYHGLYRHGLTLEITTTEAPTPRQLHAWRQVWAWLFSPLSPPTSGATSVGVATGL
jgi:hypothetical protein